MLLQDAPAPFDRVVLAVIGREVKQLHRPAGGVGKIDHALEELGALAAAFRAVVGLDLDVRNDGPLPLGQRFPPGFQAVDDEVAGLGGTAEGQVQLPAVLVDQPERGVLFRAPHVVVGGAVVAPGLPAPRVVADVDGGLAVHAQPLDRPAAGRLPVLGLEVGEDRVGRGDFFWGLALTTLRRR